MHTAFSAKLRATGWPSAGAAGIAGRQASRLAGQLPPRLGRWSWGRAGLVVPLSPPTSEWWAKGSGVPGSRRPQVFGQVVRGLPGAETDQGIRAAQSQGSASSARRAGPGVGRRAGRDSRRLTTRPAQQRASGWQRAPRSCSSSPWEEDGAQLRGQRELESQDGPCSPKPPGVEETEEPENQRRVGGPTRCRVSRPASACGPCRPCPLWQVGSWKGLGR